MADLSLRSLRSTQTAVTLSSVSGNTVISTGNVVAGNTVYANNFVGNIQPNGDVIPTANVTYNLGSASNRFKDLYLSGNTIHLGDKTFSTSDVLPFSLTINPEVLRIDVDAVDAGDDIHWIWTWQQSTLPYARATITNQQQISVPLYKDGTYTLNNFSAMAMHGNMTQTHHGYFKWIDGAGLDNLIDWAGTYGHANVTHPSINGGATTMVQQYNFTIPSTITPPTLTPPNISYSVSVLNGKFHMADMAGEGDNITLGPVRRGGTYTFNLDASLSGHNFYITTDNGTGFVSGQYIGEYTNGVTGSRNDGSTGKTTLTFVVPSNAPDTLFYQSATDATMRGSIVVKDLAVETNINGNYVVYFQHMHEGHKTPIEIKPLPSMVNQMCLVYDQNSGQFVPQDMATYVDNTPSFKNKIREVAGTATLIAPSGVAVVPTVLVVENVSYLPLVNNKDGDIAFDAYEETMYVWERNAWHSTKPVIDLSSYATTSSVTTAVANLVNSAPGVLDTLGELANALGNDASFSTTVTTSLANKLNITDANTKIDARVTQSFVNNLSITTVGTLSGLTSNGVVNFSNTSNVSLGSIANLHITGGSANAVLKTDGTGNLSWTTASGAMTYVKEYVWRGGLTENIGSLRHYIHTTSTLIGIYAYVVSAGLTQSTAVVKKNGTAINTITIPANSTNVNQSGLSVSLAAGDYLTVDITQSSSASDLYINFVYQG